MKIDIAVYTAQEGYSWQPGTVLTNERLREYKTSIGKFPAPDDPAFPIGGIFLKDEELVCYRYHVAKKIDFRGRDALYCVLGVIPKAEADAVDPLALFALPQFAAPMMPFPTSAELPTAAPEKVPDWLKNLDGVTLDVRITGTSEKPDFVVSRKTIEKAVKTPEVKPIVDVKPIKNAVPVAFNSTACPPRVEDANLSRFEKGALRVLGPLLRDLDRRTLKRLILLGGIICLIIALLRALSGALFSATPVRTVPQEPLSISVEGGPIVTFVETTGQTNSVENTVESEKAKIQK